MKTDNRIFNFVAMACTWLLISFLPAKIAMADKPNILWITSEDNGQQMGCYGDQYADTPNLDALAAKGMMYLNCWSNAPVCAPARTTIISGIYPTSLGAQHMRSQVNLPSGVKLYPEVLRAAGYYCTNQSKEDYNLTTPKKVWDQSNKTAHWRNRSEGQPFFAVFNFTTTHESQVRKRPHTPVHDIDKAPVPPYQPNVPKVRRDWAQYYDKMTEMDAEVGDILSQLEEDGLADDTIIFYYGDHGCGIPRGKRWLYESGLMVPMLVYVPPKFRELAGDNYQSGGTSERLISFVDLYPTIMKLTGLPVADYLQGVAFLGPDTPDDPQYIYGFRDRMDERIDLSRAIRDERYSYIRNFLPHRPQGQYLDYMFQTPTTQVWKKMFDARELNAAQSAFWQPKAPVELYDLESDPDQINNLAGKAEYQEIESRLSVALDQWMIDIRDTGLIPEGEILARSQDSSPYTYAHSDKFNIERILSIAKAASDPSIAQPDWNSLWNDDDNVVRYWAATHALVQAQRDSKINWDEVESHGDNDSSIFVRSVANETLARFGTLVQRQKAIDQLLIDADLTNRTAWEAMAALNALAHSNVTKREDNGRIAKLPTTPTGIPSRYVGYVGRLLKDLEQNAN